MPKIESEKPVVQVDEIHLDDFLTSREANGAGVESLTAFAYQQRKKNAFKRPVQDYEKAYQAFLSATPT